MRRIGFLVNPIAGMGGRVGLKGTDGLVEEARARGAQPRSPERAQRALAALASQDSPVELVTWGGVMGESVLESTNLTYQVLGEPASQETTASDTIAAVTAYLDASVDVILFAGGDGTAVDIAQVLADRETSVPILGIPAGVKVYSSVFAITPEDAGRIIATYERTEDREVADIDEEAYRDGTVQSRLIAVVSVPVAEAIQSAKQLRGGSVEAVVAGVVSTIDPTRPYFLGPGSTVGKIKTELGIDGTPLGVDVWQNGTTLVTDAREADLLDYLDEEPIIIISPIGGQGFIFGRGNQQFSPAVIRASELEIVAAPEKLDGIGVLRVDTGDLALDGSLRGWVKVRTGRVQRRMMQVM